MDDVIRQVEAMRFVEGLRALGLTDRMLEELQRDPFGTSNRALALRTLRGYQLWRGSPDTSPTDMLCQVQARLGRQDEGIGEPRCALTSRINQSHVLIINSSREEQVVRWVLEWFRDALKMLGIRFSEEGIIRASPEHFRVVQMDRALMRATRGWWGVVDHSGQDIDEEGVKTWYAGLEYLAALAQHPDRIYALFRDQAYGGRFRSVLLRGLMIRRQATPHDNDVEDGLVWGPLMITPCFRSHSMGGAPEPGLNFMPFIDGEVHGVPPITPIVIA